MKINNNLTIGEVKRSIHKPEHTEYLFSKLTSKIVQLVCYKDIQFSSHTYSYFNIQVVGENQTATTNNPKIYWFSKKL